MAWISRSRQQWMFKGYSGSRTTMSYVDRLTQLSNAVKDGNISGVNAALKAGADVNGHPGQACAPVVAATMARDADQLDFLLERGVDPDRPVIEELLCACLAPATTPGDRALHVAARNGNVEIVRLLLKRDPADLNAPDNAGCTPLMEACRNSHACVEVFLEAGADPTLADKRGFVAFHVVALAGHVNLVDLLYTRAPATLNCCAAEGVTPLFAACVGGNESMVSKLLSLGAMHPVPWDQRFVCPLSAAVSGDLMGVVRVMINEGGVRAVGGDVALLNALVLAITLCRGRILRLLLTVNGEQRRSEWANASFREMRLLRFAAGCCCPDAVSVLLEAGADEAVRDLVGHIPQESIGVNVDPIDKPHMCQGKEVAVRRMLQRGPAYRARSWTWPSDEEAKDAGASSDGDTAAAAADADGGVLSFAQDLKTPPGVGVRTFRPTERSGGKFFVGNFGRYCAKD